MHSSRFCPQLLLQVMSPSLHHYEATATVLSGSDLCVWPLSSSRYKKVRSRHGASDVFNLSLVPEAGLSGPGCLWILVSHQLYSDFFSSTECLPWICSGSDLQSPVHRPCNAPAAFSGLLNNLFREVRERDYDLVRDKRKLRVRGHVCGVAYFLQYEQHDFEFNSVAIQQLFK